VKREVKRGKKYDGIIMDPPKFGRAENGKIWKFEEHTKILLEACRDVLSLDPVFCLVNAYTVEYSPITLVNMLSQLMPKGTVEHGEIVLQGKNDSLPLPTSMFARWSSITD
jgi:23S rRNA (cytosine1962-C5)-methyltransferase